MIKPFLGLLLIVLLPTLATADSFNGYECTEDCSGHEAGYEWAEKNEIEDDDDCDSKSNSFTEGCISYLDEKKTEQETESVDEEKDDWEDGNISNHWEDDDPDQQTIYRW